MLDRIDEHRAPQTHIMAKAGVNPVGKEQIPPVATQGSACPAFTSLNEVLHQELRREYHFWLDEKAAACLSDDDERLFLLSFIHDNPKTRDLLYKKQKFPYYKSRKISIADALVAIWTEQDKAKASGNSLARESRFAYLYDRLHHFPEHLALTTRIAIYYGIFRLVGINAIVPKSIHLPIDEGIEVGTPS